MATITIEIPEVYLAQLGKTAEERVKFALEAVAVEGVRTGRLFKPQAGDILGLGRMELFHLLSQRRVPEEIDDEAVKEGFRALTNLFPK